ncbi:undecaprenyl/decaprenyl-phosphate alpha-N-acetylglucosaminyl 1-phosphate transferase [bacterium]|nr:undecaprenyl/decaprenyl-phosphate alpha-N-acetylglucosaminyl 1-phosphate transferase [bacterium]
MISSASIHLLSAFVAFAVVVVLVPITIHLALARGWVDEPGGRKMHVRAVPRFGGIAVFLGTWVGYGFYLYTTTGLPEAPQLGQISALLGPCSLILLLGVYDDIFGANAVKKLLVQLVAAIWAVSLGFDLSLVHNPISDQVVAPAPYWNWILSVGWIVFVTNAVNLIDGLDGLATGVALIVALTTFFISKHLGLYNVSFFSLSLAGACVGFLLFNFSPARIFLGDSGSLVIGFLLASISLEANVKRSAAIVLFGPPLVMALPILDSVMAMGRRFFQKRKVIESRYADGARLPPLKLMKARFLEIFQADQQHIHHALLKVGLSPRRAVLVLYCVTMVLGATAYQSTIYGSLASSGAVFVFLSFALIWLRRTLRRSKLVDRGHEKA